ncbi:MAG: nucleotidyltransferase family protein [Pseudomonadota bacterium]
MPDSLRSQKIFAVVLAAGKASRFGSTKQLAMWGDKTLVSHALRRADDCRADHAVVVLGHDRLNVAAAIADQAGFRIVNEDYETGMGGSIAAAVKQLRDIADAVLITLADQPQIDTGHLDAVIDQWDGTENAIVATQSEDRTIAPALFARGAFNDLCALDGDRGAQKLFSDRRFAVSEVTFEDAQFDIDTPEDLSRLWRNVRS